MSKNVAYETFFLDDDETGLSAAQETQRSLIDTQERLGMMLDVMPMGLLIHTEQGILFANQEACSMLRVSKAEAVGHHFLDFIASGQFEAVKLQLDESFVTPTSIHRQETLIVRPDASEISIKLLSGRLPWPGTPVIQLLLQDVTDLKLKEEKLRRMTITDELTGAYNRRHLFDTAGLYLDGIDNRSDCERSVISLDIDHFKRINDTYGHAVGDIALKQFVQVCMKVTNDCGRKDALFARIGGEEFLVFLPATDADAAASLAERLRQAVAGIAIDAADGPLRFTTSLGVATAQPGSRGLDALLSRADAALYEAKRSGRDRVVVASARA